MKTRHRPTRLMLLEAISQNCRTVATALLRRAAMGNSSETPRHSEATTTSMPRLLGFSRQVSTFYEPEHNKRHALLHG